MIHISESNPESGVSLLTIDATYVYTSNFRGGGWWYGSKEPVAVVVRFRENLRAFDLAQGEISIAELIDQLPELATRLQL